MPVRRIHEASGSREHNQKRQASIAYRGSRPRLIWARPRFDVGDGRKETLNESSTIDACNHLVDFQAWSTDKIDAAGWIGNFAVSERRLAAALLSRFTFYSDHLVDQLFQAAFQALSNSIRGEWKPFEAARVEWRDFCDRALVTVIQGERPNPSDSGFTFARKARQVLGMREDQLVHPSEAVLAVLNKSDRPIVFVDDFVGSGEQFRRTWRRTYPLSNGSAASFESVSKPGAAFYYCNAMTTAHGRRRIREIAPEVLVSAGNIVADDHSLTSPRSALWPPGMREEGVAFIREVSGRLGFSEANGAEDDWEGFHKLGLGLAFEHSTPDATLPIFHTDRFGWVPLVRRA